MIAATSRVTAAGVEHRVIPVAATTDIDGAEIVVAVHELRGSRPGPTLGIIGTQHGDEWLTIPAMHRIVEAIGSVDFVGTVIVVPVANPVAFRNGHRATHYDSDEPDMNRVWPGTFTWISEMLSKALLPFVSRCDALIDVHFGQWGVIMANTWWSSDVESDELREAGRRMSIAYGTSVQERQGLKHPGSRTLAAYAGMVLGIPCISGGIGGAGFSAAEEDEWLGANAQGVLNVMTTLGMRSEALVLPEQLLHFRTTRRVHPSVGGILVPDPEIVTLLPRVEAGQELGHVYNPQTLEVIERLVAPEAGWLYWTARSYPVRPGSFAFGLATEEGAAWLSPDD